MLFGLLNKTRRPSSTPSRLAAYRPQLEALEDRRLLSAGALDPTFGSGGLVTSALASSADTKGMAIQSDGKIVVTGWAADPSTNHRDFMAARYNLDGSLDTTFGNGGVVLTPVGKLDTSAWAVVIQPDGKIVAGGSSAYYGAKQQQLSEAVLVRYNPNGTLDATFGTSKQTPGIAVSTAVPQITCLALESNGEIATGINTQVALFTSRGALDTAFGQGGVVGLNAYQVNAIAVQPADGKIVAAGSVLGGSGSRLELLARLNTYGSVDSTFGAGGYVSKQYSPGTPPQTQIWSYAHSLLIQPDGKLVTDGYVREYHADGSYEDGMVLARFNSDGSPDGGFGSGGAVISTAIDGNGWGGGTQSLVALQADGSLVVAGLRPNNQMDFVTSRYTASGQLDTTWGTNGVSDVSVNGVARSCALEPNGTIVVAGGGGVGLHLARYLPSQPEVGSFTASPNPVTSGSSTTLTATNITDGNPGATVTQVAFYVQINGSYTLLGYGTQTSPGVWTLSYTVNLSPGTYTLYAQAQDSYGVLGDLAALTLQVI
jgi:uncharacterized delta-60 repeat protein